MPYTVLPSVKGQVTIPAKIREKYGITKDTPIVFEDKGKGVLQIKIMQTIDDDFVEFYETEESYGLRFKKPVDPQLLIDAINKFDDKNK